jgi:hypothetical protein
VLRQRRDRTFHRGTRRRPEPLDELVDRARAVEKREKRREERRNRRAFEHHDHLPVLEQESLAVPDEAIPGSKEGSLRRVRHAASGLLGVASGTLVSGS